MAYRAIFYDTETTGVRSEKDRVIELAAYDVERGVSFEKLIHPQCPIPPEATAIHRITDEMVANAPTFAEIVPEFLEFCSGDVVLIAHNNDGFDIHFMREEFKRAGHQLPSWKFFDTLKWARRYRPDLPRHSLQFLREIYGIAENNAHRALDDVKVLHQVYSCMIDDLTIEEAHNLLNKPRVILHMPFGKHQGTPIKEIPKNYVAWLADQGALDKPENVELKKSFISHGLLECAPS